MKCLRFVRIIFLPAKLTYINLYGVKKTFLEYDFWYNVSFFMDNVRFFKIKKSRGRGLFGCYILRIKQRRSQQKTRLCTWTCDMLGMENEGGANFPFRYIGWERVSLSVARPPLSLIYCPVDMRQPASLPRARCLHTCASGLGWGAGLSVCIRPLIL